MNDLVIPSYYEIYKQDLTKPYLSLELAGRVNTIEEARSCCRMLQEALMTSESRGLGDLRGRYTFIFNAVIKE